MSRSRFLETLLILLVLFGSLSVTLPVHGADGLVYVAPTVQPSSADGSDVVFQVMAANVDAFTGWDVELRVDPSVLAPKSISIQGNALSVNFSAQLFELAHCIDGHGTGCSPEDGIGIVHSAAAAFSISQSLPASMSGLLFTVIYTALNGGTGTSTVDIIQQAIINGLTARVIPVSTIGGFYGDSPDFGISTEPAFLNSNTTTSNILNVRVRSFNGFAGTISLEADSILPVLIKPAEVTVNSDGPANATVYVSADPCGLGGGYGIQTLGRGDVGLHSFLSFVSLTPSAQNKPNFCIQPADLFLTVQQGSTNSTRVRLSSLSGFSGVITLETDIVPDVIDGPSASLAQTSVNLLSGATPLDALTVSTSSTTRLGRYSILVNATSGSLSRFTVIHVTVIPPRTDFGMTFAAPIVSVPAGLSVSNTLSLTGLNGFNDTVTLSTSVFPNVLGAPTIAVNPSRARLASNVSNATVIVSTSTTTPNNLYFIGVFGSSNSSSSHVASFVLNVSAPVVAPTYKSVRWSHVVSISRNGGVETWLATVQNQNPSWQLWGALEIVVTSSNGQTFTVRSAPILLTIGQSNISLRASYLLTADSQVAFTFTSSIVYGLTPDLLVARSTGSKGSPTSGSFTVVR